MSKKLCKMNRKQIAESLGEIHRLVVEPKFICRSCTRVSSTKSSLCKASAIPPKSCQDNAAELSQSCGLLAESMPSQIPSIIAHADDHRPNISVEKKEAVRDVVARVKAQKMQQLEERVMKKVINAEQSESNVVAVDFGDKKSLKKAKKAMKKLHKAQKKQLKAAKKYQKALKKQRKLEKQYAAIDKQLSASQLVAAEKSASSLSASKQASLH